ncbi:MAG TPA: hypothetical protein VMN38_08080 [Sphingomicrobium sp.]|nr:hypothetical protein [Sphingomicrobium sp.]
MRKQQLENAAFEVATQVRTVEETIDSALAEIAELQSRVMRVNAIARVGVGAVHGTLEQLAAAVNGLVATRGAIVACHSALVEAKGKVPGLRVTSWGAGEECPELATAELRIVA